MIIALLIKGSSNSEFIPVIFRSIFAASIMSCTSVSKPSVLTLDVYKRQVQKGLVTGDQVYQWRNVGFTTCPAENPHYQLVSKRLVVIPGFRLVASKPAVYIGGKYLLSYPFDYVIDLSNGSRSQFLPQVMYEGDKGVGVSYGAPLAMGDVNARWKAFLWSGVGLEAVLSVDHRFSDGIVFFADASYTWDGDLSLIHI